MNHKEPHKSNDLQCIAGSNIIPTSITSIIAHMIPAVTATARENSGNIDLIHVNVLYQNDFKRNLITIAKNSCQIGHP